MWPHPQSKKRRQRNRHRDYYKDRKRIARYIYRVKELDRIGIQDLQQYYNWCNARLAKYARRFHLLKQS